MFKRDYSNDWHSLLAVLADAAGIYAGFSLAIWMRFFSGWIPLYHEGLPHLGMYYFGAGFATLLFLFIFRALRLYHRPQLGRFPDVIPRLARAAGWGILLSTALAFVLRTEPPFSRLVVALSYGTILFCVLLERYILFRLELHWARHRSASQRILILGTDETAQRLRHSLEHEPRLRCQVIGFLQTDDQPPQASIAPDKVIGALADLDQLLARRVMDRVILVDNALAHDRIVDLIIRCEKQMVQFNMVPDLFRVLVSGVDMTVVDGIPLLGVGKWPLDYFWNRVVKRVEDVAGALAGLALGAPVLAVAAVLIKRGSPGPVFYPQVRCGESGARFTLYKLRTMPCDAEALSGPVWTQPDDPRRTRVGAWLRRWNLDELPQFWNVLRGDMSLVGPRPERPVFVEQFKEDIGRYMWRHSSKPGMTGWAQVNGLRGQTSLTERIKYDLFYLENWSLALDLKIIARTLFSTRNAY
ncbi:MAG: exopolysaccharide biosynthesis polyprenyl glycosylphosphotransferase [Candidatus Marinimicrobia bacterium]|nr:exopolysaccharide biosynthesis polyprenyl glycosylphosphotransferase [Candidatus Neomarinimicrobiota bacterium]